MSRNSKRKSPFLNVRVRPCDGFFFFSLVLGLLFLPVFEFEGHFMTFFVRISHQPGACFSKVPKLFGPISGATIAVITVISGLDTQSRLMGHFPLY